MKKFLYCIISLLMFTCCDRQLDVNQPSLRQSRYDLTFKNKVGVPSDEQEWGDWYLHVPSFTRFINSDTTTWDRFKEIPYPIETDINDVILAFSIPYDGINMVNIPAGDYWVKTIYKNDYFFYTDVNWMLMFHGYEKMSSVSVYNQTEKKYEIIENIDSVSLIEYLDEYDGVMPQFAYFNELYSENYFEQRTIEYNGVYYVGFDFFVDGFLRSNSTTTSYAVKIDGRDYIYDDWIIMLIPAYRLGQETVYDEKRVMCEDLSDNNDFDFNDLVYDVAIVNLDGELKTKVTIQAIGTTESITIGGKKAQELFGVSGVYINTSSLNTSYQRDSKSFYINDVIEDIRDIDVSMYYDNELYFLNNKKGKPTHRICVSTDTKWVYEGFAIWGAYPDFKDYVSGNNDNWTKNVIEEVIFKHTY